jgi:probable rRNA maturation factor
LCERAINAALSSVEEEVPEGNLEVSLVLSDDATVRELNKTWRDKDSATNVLSFPAYDPDDPAGLDGAPILLGDIILAYETCVTEAQRDHLRLEDHLSHLVIHGFLHLLGYDHLSDEQAEEMEAQEIAILASLGIADPYKDELDV